MQDSTNRSSVGIEQTHASRVTIKIYIDASGVIIQPVCSLGTDLTHVYRSYNLVSCRLQGNCSVYISHIVNISGEIDSWRSCSLLMVFVVLKTPIQHLFANVQEAATEEARTTKIACHLISHGPSALPGHLVGCTGSGHIEAIKNDCRKMKIVKLVLLERKLLSQQAKHATEL